MKIALIQLNSSDDPEENTLSVSAYFDEAVLQGAEVILTPEVTNCVSTSRSHQQKVLKHESEDIVLAALCDKAREAGVWCLIGSLALKTNDPDGRFANRSFLIDPQGRIEASYDKINMFDVTVSETESYRESSGYRPGTRAVWADMGATRIGLTICYDIRFPSLYRTLAQQGAQILTVPSAFSPVTGAAHWETLLRARAIETGAFILAPAQTGTHAATAGKPRKTYGHSMIVGPWGDVLADAGPQPGVTCVDIDVSDVDNARCRIPSLRQETQFEGPR
ncbi:MAG: carbon-nitrogen hydrolase family protein [Pseudomonadota bacterium]